MSTSSNQTTTWKWDSHWGIKVLLRVGCIPSCRWLKKKKKINPVISLEVSYLTMYYQNFPISFILILNFILFYLYIVVWALYLVSLLCTHTHMHTHVIYYDFQFSGFLWDSEHANEWFSASVFVLCAFSWVLFLLLVCFVMFQCISFVLFILLYFIIIS